MTGKHVCTFALTWQHVGRLIPLTLPISYMGKLRAEGPAGAPSSCGQLVAAREWKPPSCHFQLQAPPEAPVRAVSIVSPSLFLGLVTSL